MNIASIAPAATPTRATDPLAGIVATEGFGALLGMASAVSGADQAKPVSLQPAIVAKAPEQTAVMPVATPLPPSIQPVQAASEAIVMADPLAAEPLVPDGDAAKPVPADNQSMSRRTQSFPEMSVVEMATPPSSTAVEAPASDHESVLMAEAEALAEPTATPDTSTAELPVDEAEMTSIDAPIPDLPVLTLPEASRPAHLEPGANLSPFSASRIDVLAAAPAPVQPATELGATSAVSTAAPARNTDAPSPITGHQIADSIPFPDAVPDGLPSSLLSQALPGAPSRPAISAQPYTATMPHEPVIAAQTGQIGREMGVEIARQVAAGREEVLIRLDPAEMGRIDVRLSFDREGSLRAVMAADSPAALDMLRRETGELTRALADAGVRSDAQSFRFDSRGGDAGQFSQRGQQGGDGRGASGGMAQSTGDAADNETVYRSLRASGRVDLMA